MNKIDRQAQIMDYLYGEMPADERRDFELWLAQNPDVQQEITELREGRNWLAEVEEVIPPPMMIDLAPEKKFDRRWLYRSGAAAAVLLALWLFNFQIRMDGGGLLLSFGQPAALQQKPPVEITPPATIQLEEQWQKLLAHNQQLLETRFSHMDSSWQARFAGLQQENQQHWKLVKNMQTHQVEQVKSEFTKEQLPRLAALMQQLQSEQQEELQLLLVEFWNTWQETRQNDLEHIDSKMTNLYQNVEYNQKASEARVVNYIQNVAGR